MIYIGKVDIDTTKVGRPMYYKKNTSKKDEDINTIALIAKKRGKINCTGIFKNIKYNCKLNH